MPTRRRPRSSHLLGGLREAGAQEQTAALASRLPGADRFGRFLGQQGGRDRFRFGRQADGSPLRAAIPKNAVTTGKREVAIGELRRLSAACFIGDGPMKQPGTPLVECGRVTGGVCGNGGLRPVLGDSAVPCPS